MKKSKLILSAFTLITFILGMVSLFFRITNMIYFTDSDGLISNLSEISLIPCISVAVVFLFSICIGVSIRRKKLLSAASDTLFSYNVSENRHGTHEALFISGCFSLVYVIYESIFFLVFNGGAEFNENAVKFFYIFLPLGIFSGLFLIYTGIQLSLFHSIPKSQAYKLASLFPLLSALARLVCIYFESNSLLCNAMDLYSVLILISLCLFLLYFAFSVSDTDRIKAAPPLVSWAIFFIFVCSFSVLPSLCMAIVSGDMRTALFFIYLLSFIPLAFSFSRSSVRYGI
ncbi:MAG: hypothetical protein J5874_00425 [Oscillospiraceae bacterium]|nr:hypothetical protein [Oscillospiraceae bacterium]